MDPIEVVGQLAACRLVLHLACQAMLGEWSGAIGLRDFKVQRTLNPLISVDVASVPAKAC